MGNLQDRMQIYSSIAEEAQRASASTATRVTLTSPWPSRTAMSSSCLGVTIPWLSRTDMNPTISTSWQVLNAFGTSTTTQPTSGSYPQTNRPSKFPPKRSTRRIRNTRTQRQRITTTSNRLLAFAPPSAPSCSALYTSTHLTLLSIAHSRHLCSIHPRIYDTKLDPAFLELLENFRRNSRICNC